MRYIHPFFNPNAETLARDEYRLWRPQQRYKGTDYSVDAEFKNGSGFSWRNDASPLPGNTASAASAKEMATPNILSTPPKPKSCPGAISPGSKTNKITTTATTKTFVCSECHGNEVVLGP